jgi:putative methionine-R-sulfoxide reductase with GAF domain
VTVHHTRRHTTRDEAILREIVEPIENGDATAADYDIEAIATEVLEATDQGYTLKVDLTTFWRIVARYAL